MNDLQKNVSKLVDNIKNFSKREARETKIASRIFVKILKNYVGLSKRKPTKEEIYFLREHSKDLVKIILMIVMFPTPIPYIEILLLLKAMGINVLLPNKEDLKVPEDHRSQ
jgi:hypothetical protein